MASNLNAQKYDALLNTKVKDFLSNDEVIYILAALKNYEAGFPACAYEKKNKDIKNLISKFNDLEA